MRARQQGFLQGPAMYAVVGLGAALAISWAAAGIGAWYLTGQADKARAETVKAREALAKEEQSRATFQGAAKACSTGVETMDRLAKEQRQAYEAAASASRKEADGVRAYVNDLLTRPRPAGLDECQATLKELNDEIDRRTTRRQ